MTTDVLNVAQTSRQENQIADVKHAAELRELREQAEFYRIVKKKAMSRESD